MTDTVPPEHAQIDADLEAWGRWSARRGGRGGSCGSAEGAYQAPWRQWHYPTAEEMMPQPVAKDMLAIDRAVVRLPMLYLELVRLHYVYRVAPGTIRRQLALRRDDVEPKLYRARQMVLNNMRGTLAMQEETC
jgi:hypothetical protein